jgi:hypothetical protein
MHNVISRREMLAGLGASSDLVLENVIRLGQVICSQPLLLAAGVDLRVEPVECGAQA